MLFRMDNPFFAHPTCFIETCGISANLDLPDALAEGWSFGWLADHTKVATCPQHSIHAYKVEAQQWTAISQ